MASGTDRDLSVFKDQQVVVLNASGQFIGTWPDAPLLAGFKETVNSGTTPLTVELPRPFDNFDLAGSPGARGTIGQGNIVQYWLFGPGLPSTGKLRYQGIIDTYNPQIKENGEETVTVTITPYSSVIADHALIGTQMFGTVNQSQTYVDPVTMFNWFFSNNDPLTGVAYASPLTLAAGNPSSSGRAAQYAFQAQSLQSIFETIKLMLPPNWFYRLNPDKSVTLNAAPTTPQHILLVGQHVANPQFAQDWINLKNVIYFVGASGSVQVGGQTLNQPVVEATVSGSDLAVFGERVQLQNDTRVTDQTTAIILAQGILNLLDQYVVRTKIRVPDYRGSADMNIGYDIESFQVGDTVQLVDYYGAPSSLTSQSVWDTAQWDVNNWDSALLSALSPVVQIISLSYNFHYVDLELGSLQPNQDLAIFNIEQRFNDFTMV
jgi:hypothetical protein